MNSYYKLLPSLDVRKDEESILEALASIRERRVENDVRLLNYYREVPISFGMSVDNIDRGLVEVTVHQLQSALLKLQKETLIRSDHFSHDVAAKVSRADTDNGVAFLSHFSYVQIFSDRRAHIRVSVSEEVEVSFRANKVLLAGKLLDISVGGMAFAAAEKPGIEDNSKGTAAFALKGSRLEFPALLLRMEDEPPLKRYIVQFFPDSKSETHISHYVFQTQSEIIRELKDKFI